MNQNIKITELKEQDLELVRNWRNSENVSQYMYTNNQISVVDQKQWFQKLQLDDTQKYWMITFEEKKIGVAYLYNTKDVFKTTYWGFYLGDTSLRGKGIGKKIEYNIIDKVFNHMNYNKLLCEVFVTNDNVIKMHEKFGFRREGYFREHILKNNTFHDVVSMAILKSEWSKLQSTLYKEIYH